MTEQSYPPLQSSQPMPGGYALPPYDPRWAQPVAPPVPTVPRSVLPVQARQYHEFWRAPKYAWWKGLIVIPVVLLAFVVIQLVVAVPMILEALKNPAAAPTSMDEVVMTPSLFLLNNISIAMFIPIAMLVTWACVGQRPKWLSSVTGGLRWRWLGWCAVITVPVWLLNYAVDTGLSIATGTNPFADMHMRDHTWFTLVAILTTTVFQCAGEEYMCRGLIPRILGSWIPSRLVGLIVGWLVSSVIFMSLHLSTDIYLNIFYFSFATVATYLTWRTGGLEAAIVLHCVNNLLAEATMPWIDYSGMMNREAGTGSPTGLVIIPMFVLLACGIEWLIRRHRPANMASPGLAG